MKISNKNTLKILFAVAAMAFASIACSSDDDIKKSGSQFNEWRQPTTCKTTGFQTICENK